MATALTRKAAYGLLAVVVAAAGAILWFAKQDIFPAFVAQIGIAQKSIKSRFSTAAASSAGANRRNRASGPVAVEVAAARASTSTEDIAAVGSLQSDESVALAPEISGRIGEIAFQEGQPVKNGDVLVKLDDSLLVAEVKDAQARLDLASANNDRAKALAKTGNVTGRGRDEAVANFETAEAALSLTQTRLSKAELKAPFDGVAGLRGISAGAFINTGTPIVNLEKIDKLKIDFKVPEIYLREVNTGQNVEVLIDAFPGEKFTGQIYAINPLVDVNGRALQVRARLANSDRILRPGLFARIVVRGREERNVVVVPEAAIVPRGEDKFVFTVTGGKAVEKLVRLGKRKNAEVEVLEGLEAGTVVVVAGQQKLRDGAIVEVVAGSQPPGESGEAESTARRGLRGNG